MSYIFTLYLTSLTSSHLNSPHLTSPHLTNLISPHPSSPPHTSLTSSHLISPNLTSLHFTSSHLISPHLTSHHFTSPHFNTHTHTMLIYNISLSTQMAIMQQLMPYPGPLVDGYPPDVKGHPKLTLKYLLTSIQMMKVLFELKPSTSI